MEEVEAIDQVIAQACRRVRWLRAISGLMVTSALWFAALTGLAVWHAFQHPRPIIPQHGVWLVALGPLLASLWPVSREQVAARIDASHHLHDRLRSALDFGQRPRAEQSPFMIAALRETAARLSSISVARAIPWRWPAAARWLLVSAALLALTFGVSSRPRPRPAAPQQIEPAPLQKDDVRAFRQELHDLVEGARPNDRIEPAVRDYERMLHQLENGELTRAAAIDQLRAIEASLRTDPASSSGRDHETLSELARALSPLGKTLGGLLERDDAAGAADELRRSTRSNSAADKRARAELEKVLSAMAQRDQEQTARERRIAELERNLAREREADPEKSLFEPRERQRERERLSRELERERAQSRQLSRLSRELADLARPPAAPERPDEPEQEKLDKDAISQVADALERHAHAQEQQRREGALRREVAQLRELLQRKPGRDPDGANAAGEAGERGRREQRYAERARGQEPGSGKDQGKERGRSPEAEPSASRPAPRSGAAQAASAPMLEEAGEPGAALSRALSEQPGAGGAPGTQPAANDLARGHAVQGKWTDSRVRGIHGQGPSRSEVILDAADRGFATERYHTVYTDYREHAESALATDEIPGGYRFYVRRYFQLIRPRERDEMETP